MWFLALNRGQFHQGIEQLWWNWVFLTCWVHPSSFRESNPKHWEIWISHHKFWIQLPLPQSQHDVSVSFFLLGVKSAVPCWRKKVQVVLVPSWRGSDSEPHGTLDSTIPLPHSAGYDGPVLLLGYSRLSECWNWWDFYPKKGVEEKSKFQAAVGEWMLKILLDGT